MSPLASSSGRWKVLVVAASGTAAGGEAGGRPEGWSASLTSLPTAESRMLLDAAPKAVADLCSSWKPDLLFVRGGASQSTSGEGHAVLAPHKDIAALARALPAGLGAQGILFECPLPSAVGEDLKTRGVGDVVIGWPAEPGTPAAVAEVFSHAFFAFLRTPGVTVVEAYALAVAATFVHCTRAGPSHGPLVAPPYPPFVHSAIPMLPGPISVPLPPSGFREAELATCRLLAPRTEAKLVVCGGMGMAEAGRLECLALALRSVLVAEARSARVLAWHAQQLPPGTVPAGIGALQCRVQSASGAQVTVTLCGAPAALEDDELREHAIRLCLCTDGMQTQVRVPPKNNQLVSARRSYAIGAACKTIELSTNMSVWATHVLLHMAGTWDNYTLPALGVAAFMGVASRFSLEDAQCMGQALRFAESPAPAVPVTGAHGLVSAAGTPVMLPPALMVAIPGLEGKTVRKLQL